MLFLSVWVSVCVFVFNKRQKGVSDPAQIFLGTSHDPEKLFRWSKFQNLASNKIRFTLNFENLLNFFIKSAKFLFLFYYVYQEKMFTIEVEDGREKRIVFGIKKCQDRRIS